MRESKTTAVVDNCEDDIFDAGFEISFPPFNSLTRLDEFYFYEHWEQAPFESSLLSTVTGIFAHSLNLKPS